VEHRPVLLHETIAALACRAGGRYVDATLGAGGHAVAILEASAPDGLLLGLDRDTAALEAARLRLERFGDRARLLHADHRRLPEILDALPFPSPDGIVFDLGVSSLQLDDAARGFSFRSDGPLDMRMDRSQPTTAACLVNRLTEPELRTILARYGEEKAAGRIAAAIVRARAKAPLTRTAQLAALVAAAAGPRRGAGRGMSIDPATRTFQALRIAVNGEVEGLEALLEEAAVRLRPGGRLAVIAFHSLEDRAVKTAFRAMAQRCICPRGLPRCGCGRPDLVRLVGRGALRPSPAEVRDNPRSRSARLRACERLEAA
jgi:16S rRNA (cytosine1402-N4)-methyltransferase